MGLCKCRTVTTLFCFEHRKNICEKCVISEHPTCVVKTYLQWLQDSDFDPNCPLCREPLDRAGEGGRPNIRLACFDLFHLDCLERELSKICSENGESPTLTRAKCPLCRVPVLPVAHEVSPLYTQIRSIISQHSKTFSPQLSSIPSAPPPPPEKSSADPTQNSAFPSVLNGVQPNGMAEMIAIDMGPRAHFMEAGRAVGAKRQQPNDPKLHGPPGRSRHLTGMIDGLGKPSIENSLRSVMRILLNCITLRNVRVLSLGVSPRQTMLIAIALICILVFTLQFMLPALNISSPV